MLCAHINSVHFHGLLSLQLLLCPRGIQVSPSTLLILLKWQQNHLHHLYWFVVTAALTFESGIELSMSIFCVVYHKSQKEERGQKSVGLMSPPWLTGPILFYRSHSAIVESPLTSLVGYMQEHPSVLIQCCISASSPQAGKRVKLNTTGEIAECSISWLRSSKRHNLLCYKSETLPPVCAFFFSSHSPSAVVSSKDSSSIHGDTFMDLRVTQRFLHPGPDSAMLAPHPPFFLGQLTSQNCSQLTQHRLQVGREKFEVGPVTLKSNIMYTGEGVGSLFCVWGEKAEGAHQLSGVTSAVGLSFSTGWDGIISMFWIQN